jgi:hypothetical protein
VKFVDNHKHVGIVLNSQCKWLPHIDSIINTVKPRLNILRKFKFLLRRDTLNTLYVSYIRPTLEYNSAVWNGLTTADEDRLEKIQLEAARIITGLTLYTSRESLYRETGWQTLATRRRNLVPNYLTEIFPPSVGEVQHHMLRNNMNFVTPAARRQLSLK